MTYELCKQLHDAGYKLPTKYSYDEFLIEGERDVKGELVRYRVPTLSELIEACGDCLSHIKKWNGYWWAVSHCGHPEHEFGGNNLEEQGVTPEIAVANLWLELNK